MLRKGWGLLAGVFCFAAITGCYGTPTSKLCDACAGLQEGQTEGSEWTGEYINEQFKCKLEGGDLMVQHGEEWKSCS